LATFHCETSPLKAAAELNAEVAVATLATFHELRSPLKALA
jgi:hypothetical protein